MKSLLLAATVLRVSGFMEISPGASGSFTSLLLTFSSISLGSLTSFVNLLSVMMLEFLEVLLWLLVEFGPLRKFLMLVWLVAYCLLSPWSIVYCLFSIVYCLYFLLSIGSIGSVVYCLFVYCLYYLLSLLPIISNV
jgi:hypothetical protein